MKGLNVEIDTIFPKSASVPKRYKLAHAYEQKEYLIGGEIRIWNGPVQQVLSPVCISDGKSAKRKVIGSYPLLTAKEALEAIEAARKAYDNGYGKWPTMSVEQRIKCVEDFIFRMAQKRDEIVNLLMWEIGKSLPDSEKEFDRTIDYVKDTIEALKELDRNSSRLVVEKGILAQIRRAPLGVVLCMGPYNYPLNETFTTLIPALIMGNTTIFKPAKMGVLLHLPLLEAFRDAFPPGVVNTVYGDGKSVVGPLMESGKVDSLAFIGSSRVANILKHQHPRLHRMKSVLGLDAKNAAIILPDSDLDLAVNEALLGSLSYNGQRCTALKILFVHRSVADKFNEKFCAKIEAMKIGMPWTDGVQITPLPEDGKSSYLTDLIKDAEANGAGVLNPSGGIFNETFFFPAVLYPVNEKMRVYSEEQFGPLVPVVPFDNIEEPLKYITDSNYGQQASIFGNDAEQISDLIDPLVNQLSRININSQCQRGPDTFPFTGRKDSAENTLSVSDALKVFSIRALVAAKLTDSNKTLINNILKNNKSNFLSTDFIL